MTYQVYSSYFQLGVLSGIMVKKLANVGVIVKDVIKDMDLQNSFYCPSTLLLIKDEEFTFLASQFVSPEAWAAVSSSSCHKKLMHYFDYPREKREYLAVVKVFLELKNVNKAVELLSKTLEFGWPESYRFRK